MSISRRLTGVGILLLALLIVGTLGYILIEGWRWHSALFMTVITLSTVGYGEERPLTFAGEIFTMTLIVLGVGAAAYTFSTLTDYIVAGELGGALRRQRMKREIGKLRRHYIICGYGRVGRQVAEVLEEADLDVVIIDNHPGAAEDLDARNGLYVIGSATDDDVLRQAGIEQAKGLCSCLPQDADNVFVVLSARALNPELTIISRSNLAESAAKLRMAGANQIINPYLITGRRMAAQLVHPTVVEFLDVVMQRGDLELRIEELIIGSGSNMAGKTMAECHVRSETGVNVLAVRRADGTTYTDMGADFVFQAGDSLISLGTPHQLALLAERAADRRQWTRIAKRLTGQPPK